MADAPKQVKVPFVRYNPSKHAGAPGGNTIEFMEDAREERVHPIDWENPKSEESGARYDILYAKGLRLENIAYSRAIYWINRGVARMVQADETDRAAYAKQQQRLGGVAAPAKPVGGGMNLPAPPAA